MSARIAVFASGNGSNLEAILLHGVAVDLVVSDRADAGALARAARRGVESLALADHTDGTALHTLLHDRHIDLIALAGYLRHVPDAVTHAYRGRMLNVHPSLLPAFGGPGMYGHRVHAAALAAGVRVSGATVHFVDEVYDRGPIIAQWPVPVLPTDTPDTLAARVLRVEHALYPRAVAAVAAGDVRLDAGGQVLGSIDTIPIDAVYRLDTEEHLSTAR
ncbi:MAG TPA: phosphoribosylglycinamide formyltransferase [Gemmatimonadaceae bacterium]|nr:phosphoribosylglycinamide formyltransferase [Gemmatimonadaceae bacterium]